MNKKKLVAYGFLTWMIPFVLSFAFFGRDGQPLLPMGLVKSLMIVVGAIVGAFLLVRLFSTTSPSTKTRSSSCPSLLLKKSIAASRIRNLIFIW